ncbi:hypothetical protein BDR04DRAFT_1164009 [Suillus decipiens]|nr:hypothetical protein BDR04DRAFT_1164009 [Suillus decipiens]
MSETTCRSCNSTYSIPSEPRAARKAKDDHSKQCSFAVKNCKGFPVAFVDGKFCCPFRYNGCLFSAKIDPVRKHQCSFGPVTGHTPQTVYGDAASLRPNELGQYIETNYADTLRGAKKVAGTPSGVESVDASSDKIPSCQTQVKTPDAQPAAGKMERTSAQDDVTEEMHSKDCLTARGSAPALPGMTAETTVATAVAAIPVLTAFTTTPGTSLLRHSNVEAESDRSLQHGTGIENSPSRPQCAANNDSDGSAIYGSNLPGDTERSESNQGPTIRQHAALQNQSVLPSSTSTENQIPQVDVDDPLCHVIQVQELEGMSLMTSFQPDLKLFVCERCRFAVWADHLTGHIFNNHKSLLPQSIKRPLVDAAVNRARDRLQAAQSHQLKVPLPQRLLPPLPWLLEPVQGYRCFHCPYVAASIGTISIHSKTLHPASVQIISLPSFTQCYLPGTSTEL